MDVMIVGCGYTGRRVAERMAALGASIRTDWRGGDVPRGALVLHSIPPAGPWREAIQTLGDAPARVVYISSTAVYGAAKVVNETTPVDDSDPRAKARLEAERMVRAGPWSSLILRSAAIYGPGRGAHESFRRGSYVAGENVVSRIHVDDLAAHVVAGLLSNVTGAFPVADEEPCTSREMAEFCEKIMGLERGPEREPSRDLGDRHVDGSAIRRALGIRLMFPSYRVGIPACLRGN